MNDRLVLVGVAAQLWSLLVKYMYIDRTQQSRYASLYRYTEYKSSIPGAGCACMCHCLGESVTDTCAVLYIVFASVMRYIKQDLHRLNLICKYLKTVLLRIDNDVKASNYNQLMDNDGFWHFISSSCVDMLYVLAFLLRGLIIYREKRKMVMYIMLSCMFHCFVNGQVCLLSFQFKRSNAS